MPKLVRSTLNQISAGTSVKHDESHQAWRH